MVTMEEQGEGNVVVHVRQVITIDVAAYKTGQQNKMDKWGGKEKEEG